MREPAASEEEEAVPLLWFMNGDAYLRIKSSSHLAGQGTHEKAVRGHRQMSIPWISGRGLVISGFSDGVDMAEEPDLQTT